MSDKNDPCPVCGYPDLPEDRYQEICPCCGTQFGYHDCSTPHEKLRRRWIAAGADWDSKATPPPPGWSATQQLKQAGFDPNWEVGQPVPKAVQAMWQILRVSPVPTTDRAVEQLLVALREARVNGGALFYRFHLSPHPVLNWFLSRNRLQEIGFFEWFLRCEAVSAALPELNPTEERRLRPDFQRHSSFTLDGEIADEVCRGGAYRGFPGSARQAKDLGVRFCDFLWGDRFTDVSVFRSGTPWSSWFYDVAWDATWLILDRQELLISLLCITDTD